MTSEHVINLLGGLALFIFGMTFMSDGLKKLAGDYMKTILEKLTEKRIMAVLLGAGLTALIQSSNAMCVMTVGFVNAGMMQLERSVGIIMGAKLGTTITGQLLATKLRTGCRKSWYPLCRIVHHEHRNETNGTGRMVY